MAWINTLGNDHVRGYHYIRQDDSRMQGQIQFITSIFLMKVPKKVTLNVEPYAAQTLDDSRCVSQRGIQGCNVKRLPDHSPRLARSLNAQFP